MSLLEKLFFGTLGGSDDEGRVCRECVGSRRSVSDSRSRSGCR